MSSEKIDNGACALRGLERQAVRLPLVRCKISDKIRGLLGLCFWPSDTDTPYKVLQNRIAELCEGLGFSCTYDRCLSVSDTGDCCDVGNRDEGRVQTSKVLPSCQVSVEEKIQLFSFLRKG